MRGLPHETCPMYLPVLVFMVDTAGGEAAFEAATFGVSKKGNHVARKPKAKQVIGGFLLR